MDFIVDLIVVLLKVLIFIGDSAIAFFKFLVFVINQIAIKVYYAVIVLRFKLERLKIDIENKFNAKRKLLNFQINFQNFLHSLNLTLQKNKAQTIFLFRQRIKKPNFNVNLNIKRRPRIKQKVIFHSSPFTKIKYFLIGTFFSALFVFAPLLAFIFIQDLPNPKTLSLQSIPQTTKIYDRNGALLYQIYATENRTIVPLSSIPDNLKKATIAIEDKDFYNHPGFDFLAILRSAYENISGSGFSGASTITQQLIKSALLSPEVSIKRKVKEIILAFWAERIYTKDQILGMYFNEIPYGGTAWGAQAAASIYFGKDVKDLALAESAFLAGIPKAPTVYSPFGSSPNLWKKRQEEVLARMQALGFIDSKQVKAAKNETLVFKEFRNPLLAPHFVMYIKDLLVKEYGLAMVEKGGLSVKTTLDLNLQNKVQQIVKEEVDKSAYLNLGNGAALVTNPSNGDILAMVGSSDFSKPQDGNYNVATAIRQPGSSIKVVTYSAALSRGFTAATILDDSPISYSSPGSPTYAPVNYDGRFHGRIPLRFALANSFNVPAVKTLNQIGIPTFVSYAKKMGITTWKDPSEYGLAITLGAADVNMLDLATVYGVLANNGERINLNPILKVVSQKGEVLEEKTNTPSEFTKNQVLDPGVAFIMSDILADNNARSWEFGTRSPLVIKGHRVPVKTGTSDNKRDNWTVGYSSNSDFLVAAWVGNNDNSPMSQNLASGITGAAPVFNRVMTMLLQDTKDQPLIVPANVIQKDCNGRKEYFIKGTEKSVNCNWRPFPSVTPSPTP